MRATRGTRAANSCAITRSRAPRRRWRARRRRVRPGGLSYRIAVPTPSFLPSHRPRRGRHECSPRGHSRSIPARQRGRTSGTIASIRASCGNQARSLGADLLGDVCEPFGAAVALCTPPRLSPARRSPRGYADPLLVDNPLAIGVRLRGGFGGFGDTRVGQRPSAGPARQTHVCSSAAAASGAQVVATA